MGGWMTDAVLRAPLGGFALHRVETESFASLKTMVRATFGVRLGFNWSLQHSLLREPLDCG